MIYATWSRRASLAAAGLLMLCSLTGCGAIGALASKVTPDPQTPAVHTLAKETTLVLVENYRNPASVALTSEQLATQLSHDLLEHSVAPVVNPQRLTELKRTHSPVYAKADTAAIGRMLDAKQVLYVDLLDFTLDPGTASQMIRGRAEARVRVVDTATGKTRWPTDQSGGYPIHLQTPFVAIKDDVTEGTFREELIRTLAERIGRLFYSYDPNTDPLPAP